MLLMAFGLLDGPFISGPVCHGNHARLKQCCARLPLGGRVELPEEEAPSVKWQKSRGIQNTFTELSCLQHTQKEKSFEHTVFSAGDVAFWEADGYGEGELQR